MTPSEDGDNPAADRPPDPLAEVAARRAAGAAQADPVRWHHIEALARKAEAHPGRVRELLARRVSVLLQAHGATEAPASNGEQAVSPPGPLAGLVASLAAHAAAVPSPLPTPGRPPAMPEPTGPQELKSLRYFRDTWTRLAADRRLAQAAAALPDNAGPLNSQLLVHRALRQMRETSPAYLQHFMGYVEALLWMEQAQQNQAASRGAAAGKDAATAKGRPRARVGTTSRKR